MKIGKKNLNHLFLQTVIVYIDNPKGSIKFFFLGLIREFSKGNTQKLVFFYTITTNN